MRTNQIISTHKITERVNTLIGHTVPIADTNIYVQYTIVHILLIWHFNSQSKSKSKRKIKNECKTSRVSTDSIPNRDRTKQNHCISARKMHFAVIGSGVVGLTTALELQKQVPNGNVTIVADKFGIETTSYVAAGIFRPGTNFSGPTDDITRCVRS